MHNVRKQGLLCMPKFGEGTHREHRRLRRFFRIDRTFDTMPVFIEALKRKNPVAYLDFLVLPLVPNPVVETDA